MGPTSEGEDRGTTRSYRVAGKVIFVKGSLDVASASKLRERIQRAMTRKPQAIAVNLSEVTAMDSAGVAVLVEGMQWARREKILFVLQSPSKPAQSVIEVQRLDKLFQIAP